MLLPAKEHRYFPGTNNATLHDCDWLDAASWDVHPSLALPHARLPVKPWVTQTRVRHVYVHGVLEYGRVVLPYWYTGTRLPVR